MSKSAKPNHKNLVLNFAKSLLCRFVLDESCRASVGFAVKYCTMRLLRYSNTPIPTEYVPRSLSNGRRMIRFRKCFFADITGKKAIGVHDKDNNYPSKKRM